MRGPLLGCLLALVPAGTEAATLQVALDGSQEYTSIQQAILDSVAGDTVLVHPGRYLERLFYGGARAVVKSVAGPAKTIIDAQGTGSVVVFLAAEPRESALEGFTLTGGSGTILTLDRAGREGGLRYGGAIICTPGNPTLRNLWIVGNTANVGGGIYGQGSAPWIEDCLFDGNVAGDGAGAAFEFSGPIFRDCRFQDHSGVRGGGLYLADCFADVQRCRFDRNTGGAVFLQSITGGDEGDRSTIELCIFAQNSLPVVFSQFSTTDVRRNLFFRNGPELPAVAAVMMSGGRTADLTHNLFFENETFQEIACSDAPPTPVSVACNDHYGSSSLGAECLAASQNVALWPFFCDPDDPLGDGFGLRPDSPLLPENSPGDCGQIGPFGKPACPADNSYETIKEQHQSFLRRHGRRPIID